MKMRQKRRMRTRPRLWECAASIPCKPYTASIGGMEFPMTTRRVKFSFYMQSASHGDYMRKIRALWTAQRAAQSAQGGE